MSLWLYNFTMNYELKKIKIEDILKLIKEKKLYLKPDINSDESDLKQMDILEEDDGIQRLLVWNNKSIQSLIGTIFSEKIIPSVILNNNESKSQFNYSIIDGKQRLNSIWMFYNNKFPFKDSSPKKVSANFDKKNFPKSLQKIGFTPILYIIDEKTQKIEDTFVGYSSRDLFLDKLK